MLSLMRGSKEIHQMFSPSSTDGGTSTQQGVHEGNQRPQLCFQPQHKKWPINTYPHLRIPFPLLLPSLLERAARHPLELAALCLSISAYGLSLHWLMRKRYLSPTLVLFFSGYNHPPTYTLTHTHTQMSTSLLHITKEILENSGNKHGGWLNLFIREKYFWCFSTFSGFSVSDWAFLKSMMLKLSSTIYLPRSDICWISSIYPLPTPTPNKTDRFCETGACLLRS